MVDPDQSVEFVDRAHPLVFVRLPPRLGTPEINAMFEGFDRVQGRRLPYFVVVDTLPVLKLPNSVERKMITDRLRDPARTVLVRELNLGSAIALSSRAARGVLTALNWIRQPATPQAIVETVEEAMDIGLGRLRERGIEITPAMIELRAQQILRRFATSR